MHHGRSKGSSESTSEDSRGRWPLPNETDRPLAELELEGWEGKPKWGDERIDMNWAIETMWRPKVEGGEPSKWKPGCL